MNATTLDHYQMPTAVRHRRATCPLCRCEESSHIDEVRAAEVANLWRQAFQLSLGDAGASTIELRQCQQCLMKYFLPLSAGDEQLYSVLAKSCWYYPDDKPEYEIAINYLSGCRDVLEVGAGAGTFQRKLGAVRYVGLELSTAAIEEAAQQGIQLMRETVEDYARSRPGIFDAVCLFQVLEHVPNVRAFLEACRDLLRDHGVLIVAVPSDDSFVGQAVNNVLNMPPHHLTRWPDRALCAIATELDLELIDVVHEAVAPIHRTWARQVHLNAALRKLCFLQPKIVDRTIASRVISCLSHIMVRSGIYRTQPDRGHTVVAVYRKCMSSL